MCILSYSQLLYFALKNSSAVVITGVGGTEHISDIKLSILSFACASSIE